MAALSDDLEKLSFGDSEDEEGEEEEEDESAGAVTLSPEVQTKRKEWEREQSRLKSRLITADSPVVRAWAVGRNPFANLKYIGGVDISFVKGSDKACAMLVVLSFPDLKVLHVSKAIVYMTEPYIPGFLGFREVQFLVDRLEEVRQEKPDMTPEVILVDGNGILHPRGLGLASHLGVLTNIPCIGVAKKLFCVDGLQKGPEFREKVKNLAKKGDHFDLRGNSGKVLGRVIRTSDGAPNPVYISVGHSISLDTTTQLVIACSIKRIPEPTRKADLLSRDLLRSPTKKGKQ